MDQIAQNAAKMERMTEAIMSAIGKTGDSENLHVVMGSLGSVIGCVAQASGRPDECLDVMNKMARGIISGELLSD